MVNTFLKTVKITFLTAILSTAWSVAAEPLTPSPTTPPFPIIKCFSMPSQYELILMTKLRDKTTSVKEFRITTKKIAALLINKVIECLPTKSIEIDTPEIGGFKGLTFASNVELVSCMRSGDALSHPFTSHFPKAPISKILIQRDEETAEPHFHYIKLSPSVASGNPVIIMEPMIATGGTLNMAISLLKEAGVQEEQIIIATLCSSPEGLSLLNANYPLIRIVTIVIDQKLNERKFIVPGMGDFGDRFFGTHVLQE